MDDDSQFFKELRSEFFDEQKAAFEELEASIVQLDNPVARDRELESIFRVAHSIKGGAAALGFEDLATFAHRLEDLLGALRDSQKPVAHQTVSLLLRACDALKERFSLGTAQTVIWDGTGLIQEFLSATAELKPGTAAPTSEAKIVPTPLPIESLPAAPPVVEEEIRSPTLRVDTGQIETVLSTVGELVVIKSQLLNMLSQQKSSTRLSSVVANMEKTIRSLQDRTLYMQMTRVRNLLRRAKRVARDLGIRLGKPLEVTLEGEDLELDRGLIEQLVDPLIHLVRNSLDHGIEDKETRLNHGKPETGSLHLSARQVGNRVVLQVQDDGQGIDPERVIHRAKQLGMLPPEASASTVSRSQIHSLLLAPGFSTKDKVTDVSGRGVGMNVVNTHVQRMRGTLDIDSVQGLGTTVRISVPMTTMIMDGMLIRVSGETYILPIDGIQELVDLREAGRLKIHEGIELLQIREAYYPIVYLEDYLKCNYQQYTQRSVTKPARGTKNPSRETVIVYQYDSGTAALRVDELVGQAQLVFKPLSPAIKNAPGISGTSILRNGRVALMLDIAGLVKSKETDVAHP